MPLCLFCLATLLQRSLSLATYDAGKPTPLHEGEPLRSVTGNTHHTMISKVILKRNVVSPPHAVMKCIYLSLCIRSRDLWRTFICLSLDILTGLADDSHLEDLLQYVMLLAGPLAGCMSPSS